ncbi:hypothetical protein HGRIS_007234 [Hohenbuehelia grisea]|uniref:NADH:flavin oxidoreductase/NADH oxidase N-terminal domain-containing protein n=1 Tax=Hohenbuehelia grisea TaxID=104357 RepID=A0ABR3JBU6_9AGAR
MPSDVARLFQPIKVGNMQLSHRIVLAPLTRHRGTARTHMPTLPIMRDYYEQRASTPGSLLISEGTMPALKTGGYSVCIPGIWNDEQIAAWKEIVNAVHAKGSYIFMQIWVIGRTADPAMLASEDPSSRLISSSDTRMSAKLDQPIHPLTADETREWIQFYATAADNAVHKAGFDGVEVHGAHGYLPVQFLEDGINTRTDEYGGSVENRARFVLEVVDAIVAKVGAERAAIRFSPWARFMDMGMPDPVPTYSYVVSQLAQRHPNLAYIHVVEPRVSGVYDRDASVIGAHESNDFLRKIWAPRPFISAGGFVRETAVQSAEAHENELVAFGRWYISNPDLPRRLRDDIPLSEYDRSSFYTEDDKSGRGYTDYPFAAETNLL